MREVADKEIHLIETDGQGEITKFSMAADGFMFDNLISNLYSDKVASVLREIVSNAIDAHAMSKRFDRAIDVFLPTHFSPTFSVRDYGEGMTDAFIKDLYSIVGHSEKRRTNLATGMFGLGSKSPFAITDTFTVTVFQNGQKRVYNAHRLEDRTPALRNMSVTYKLDADGKQVLVGGKPIIFRDYESTDEPDGVLVTIPVSPGDVLKFEQALKKNAFAYHDTNIRFSRKLTGDVVDVMESVRRDTTEFVPGLYQIAKGNDDDSYRYSYGNLGKLYIRQGSAIYPLSVDHLDLVGNNLASYDERREFDEVSSLLRKEKTDLLFDVPIGTFAVTPSREAISYDDRSVKNLSKYYAACLRAARDKLSAVIGDARTYREAMTKVMESYPADKRKVWSMFDAAQEIVKFSSSRIQANWSTWRGKQSKDMRDSIPYNYSTATTVEASSMFPGLNVIQLSGLFNIVGSSVSRWNVDKSAKSNYTYPVIALIIPFGVREWELRAQKRVALPKTFDGYDLSDASSVRVAIFRCRNADVAIVKAKLDVIDAFVTVETFNEATWPVIPEAERQASHAQRPRYSKNAVFVLNGRSWTDTKVEVDFTQPAYYIARNGAHHDNLFVTETERADFNTAKHWVDMLPAGNTWTGLRVRGTIDTYDIAKIIPAAAELGFIDKTLPIYRLTPLQVTRLKDMPNHGLRPLLKTVIDKVVAEKDAYVAFKVTEAGAADSYYSVSAYAAQWLNNRASLSSATFSKLLSTDEAAESKRELVEVALSDPTQAYAIALFCMRNHTTGALHDKIVATTKTDHSRDKRIVDLAEKLFSMPLPIGDVPAVKAASEFGDAAVSRFSLLADKRIEQQNITHAIFYMKAVIAGIPSTKNVPSILDNVIGVLKELVTIPPALAKVA